ncbi:MAG: inorganic pyrophosphatase [Dysgonamonadaceae bacterium]|jgi:inorganic pyrophosphatase|nr:inorganic pyrophosphatase [Dysgonamonadaceae bacterium]
MYKQFKAHPWHGVSIGNRYPEVVTAFIEIVPTDTVKYEVDKETGYLSIDRPQKYSNIIPALYGFIPQTYSGTQVAELSNLALGRQDIVGDGDPVDICVLTEKDIIHGDLLVKVRPIGGFRLLDGGQADDKLIAVMYDDAIYGSYNCIDDIPPRVIERLRHYFTTYKDIPGSDKRKTELTHIYDVDVAHEVILRAINDYKENFWKIG